MLNVPTPNHRSIPLWSVSAHAVHCRPLRSSPCLSRPLLPLHSPSTPALTQPAHCSTILCCRCGPFQVQASTLRSNHHLAAALVSSSASHLPSIASPCKPTLTHPVLPTLCNAIPLLPMPTFPLRSRHSGPRHCFTIRCSRSNSVPILTPTMPCFQIQSPLHQSSAAYIVSVSMWKVPLLPSR